MPNDKVHEIYNLIGDEILPTLLEKYQPADIAEGLMVAAGYLTANAKEFDRWKKTVAVQKGMLEWMENN